MMAVVSWAVMINRLGYLNKVGKGNARFLQEWNHLARDLTALDHGDAENLRTLGGRIDPACQRAMRSAPLYHIYHIGTEEIRRRFASSPDVENRVLSPQSLQAIRASLDGALVRETQKLSKLMVFLTLSIAGGPFLGLLGTVVGVMITFAAIAAEGDVNVNAIAPGIAAALVATVAGLGVAIPALFGYNYLISRIKNATSDMHVFVDEFVTKMAEYHSGAPENTNWR
jgi:biopolymer transport protein ExbB